MDDLIGVLADAFAAMAKPAIFIALCERVIGWVSNVVRGGSRLL